MAVTLNAQRLACRMRLIAEMTDTMPNEQRGEVQAVLDSATALVLRYAPDAPDAIHNEAATRLASFLYDSPASNSTRFQNPMQQSGATALLSGWRVQRAKPLEC